MSKMSEVFYDLLEMMEQGSSDQEISDELGFPVEMVAVWRKDAGLMPDSTYEELNVDVRDDAFARLERDDPDADLIYAPADESELDYNDF